MTNERAKEIDAEIADIQAEIQNLDKQRKRLVAKVDEKNSIHKAHGWSRYYLCLSVNGHVHSDPRCPSLKYNSSLAWLVELSADSEADVVAEYGADVCTVCNPTAPVVKWSKSQNARDEKAAEKNAEKAAKKAAADADKITVDGVDYKNLRAANKEISEMIEKALWYGVANFCGQPVDEAAVENLIAKIALFSAAGVDVVKASKNFMTREKRDMNDSIKTLKVAVENNTNYFGEQMNDVQRADCKKRLAAATARIEALPSIADRIKAVA